MRTIFSLLLALSMSYGYCQNLNNCGVDNEPHLNNCESTLLNEYLKNQKGDFDFTDKKVLFVSGSSGSTIISKQSYFDGIKKYNEANSRVVTSLIPLNEKEKLDSGGYDAIVTCWVKAFGGTRRVIKKIKQDANKT